MIGRYRGAEINTAGDGFLATFDGPARGVRCAQAIVEAVRPLGLEVRAGLHTGEVEMIDGTRSAASRSTSARASARWPARPRCSSRRPSRIWSPAPGSTFEDAGEHELKGVPDRWRLYRVVS